MSLYRIFDVAGSGMSAQSVRLNTTASNMANAESISSSVNQTYRARHPVFSALLDKAKDAAGAEVKVRAIVESPAPVRMEYRPDHPLANSQGYIYLPNVNPAEELADMISASRSYQDDVEVLNTSKQLMSRTLDLGR
ncbi:flagellar basal-body rod protein FlgC [Gammaproteobacteria bacterium]